MANRKGKQLKAQQIRQKKLNKRRQRAAAKAKE
jgi:hypothetical protein